MDGVGHHLDEEGNYFMSVFSKGFPNHYGLCIYKSGDWFLGEMSYG